MERYQEPIHYQNERLGIKVRRFVDDSPPGPAANRWHYHPEVEFVALHEGGMTMRTPGREYRLAPGDVVVIGSSRLHLSRKSAEGALAYTVLHVDLQRYFDPAMMMYYRHFSELAHPLDDLNYVFGESAAAAGEAAAIIAKMLGEITDKPKGYEIAASMHVKHLLLTLLRHDRRELLQSNEFVDGDAMRPVLDYVNAHLAERIEMDEVCRLASMNYSAFSKSFKKALGVSFVNYVNRQRIRKAEQALVTGSASVADIAAGVGIGNMAHFYELFRRYNGCTPKEYKHRLLRTE
ncbi:helix-turn-helix domain-containing protein [Paenibacillus sp. MWE-103]|uniref:Helix-turn-helix domain-containing protein n=1 Tax=Paenibacillus artemisiicola TaxID=1172618 RepID=A0ABS3W3W0_9BACL|nr:AraC family transcriptional regulator [Paenibacillus artemisiicola]MBO7742993.1 helix-turn-helix domain-containing protein [Paenibacillus artemisiicola]